MQEEKKGFVRRRPLFVVSAVVLGFMALIAGGYLVVLAATVSDTYSDETKISQSYQINVDTTAGQVKLATWSCGDNFTDPRDDTAYTTAAFGGQCWMQENLNYGTRINGSGAQSDNSTVEKYCYSDNESNCDTYGGLYQWGEVMNYAASCNGTGEGSEACASPVQGLCPDGWHIPSHYEYVALERQVCTSGSCATDFPYDTSTTGWRGTNEGTTLKSTGASDFKGLLAGARATDGSFFGLSAYGFFWSSLGSGSNAWSRRLYSSAATVYRYPYTKAYGFSVRCVKD